MRHQFCSRLIDIPIIWDKIQPAQLAGVAELADALRSGRSELTFMRVQVPPSAHKRDLLMQVSFSFISQSLAAQKMDMGGIIAI